MNLAEPAPVVETAVPAQAVTEKESGPYAEPPMAVEAAEVEPAPAVEPATLVDDPRKMAPSNAVSYLQQRAKMSVETLRREGADFEGRAAVCRGAPKKPLFKILLPFLFDQRDFVTYSEIARYAVIRGGVCFIFLEPTDSAPLYAFSLADIVAEIEDPDQPDKGSCTVSPVADTNKPRASLVTVLLRNKKTKTLSYQFTFETANDPVSVKKFMDVVQQNAKACSQPVEAKVVAGQSNRAKGSGGKEAK